DRGRRARLVEEARDEVLPVRHLANEQLDRSLPADQHVLAEVDGAHPAFTQLADEAVLADNVTHHADDDSDGCRSDLRTRRRAAVRCQWVADRQRHPDAAQCGSAVSCDIETSSRECTPRRLRWTIVERSARLAVRLIA